MRSDNSQVQKWLLVLAAIFLGLYALTLTLAPAVRARSGDVDYAFGHWLGFGVWLAGFWIVHAQTARLKPQRDPYLLPIIALLTGWGNLTIWRLTFTFGLRQTIWLALALAAFVYGLRLPASLGFLRRYKYLWLTGGLLLTLLTLIFGTNPLGYGPRLWLGCCGIYLQPSEPLKLLLVVYLSAYFADWQSYFVSSAPTHHVPSPAPRSPLPTPRSLRSPRQLNVFVPTLLMTGLALLLLLVQRDLGTASVFIFLYSVMVYLATGWRWVPLLSFGTLTAAGGLGYLVFDVIRLRVDAWLNPWLDPAGRSYQIVQSLISVANGGILGRGPGLGSPSLVPVAHSDFIFAAIAEEGGLLGSIAFYALLGLLVHRGIRLAILSPDSFRRYLSGGLTAFLAAQSILIIGGNLRLLPLTGVTLPFVSYGGSSLLVSFVCALLLLHISSTVERSSSFVLHPSSISPLSNLSGLLFLSLSVTGLVTGWWAFVRGPDLLTRTDNPRRAIADRSVLRGSILDRSSTPLAETVGQSGNLERVVTKPDLGPIIGYSHPIYGQTGLEASLDPYLRGTQGHDPFTTWWHHLLYGQSPPGLDIRLTLDLGLQEAADQNLADHTGALILLNADSGEILALASHPTFDPNRLDDSWDALIQDPRAPLVNRVTQGSYPLGELGGLPFIGAVASLESDPISLRLPLAETEFPEEATPLEIALAAAALSNGGTRPAPRIAQMVKNPRGGWLLLPKLTQSVEILNPAEHQSALQNLEFVTPQIWRFIAIPDGEDLTWYVAGTAPSRDGVPLALVIVLEEKNPQLADEIGRNMFDAAGIK